MNQIKSNTLKATLSFIPIFLFLLLATSCERSALALDEESTDEISEFDEEESDYIWNEDDVIQITMSDNSTSSASGITVSGDTITITSAGTYSLTGSLSDGQIIVNVVEEELVRLLFNGINIHCSSNAPVYVLAAEKVVIYLEEGTENYLSDGATYSGFEDPNACIYSKSDLTIFGEGELTVTANYNDGITSKDGILINSANLYVDAIDDGIRGKDFLVISEANITIEAGGDGLLSDSEDGYIDVESGVFNISSDADAIQSDYDLSITGGTFTIDADDDAIHADNILMVESAVININSSSEGFEAPYITINSGTIAVSATDDGFNATQGSEVGSNDGSQLTVNDGTITVTMTGYDVDAMDSNGDITINGGLINLYIPTNTPASALDANGTITIADEAQVYENGEEYVNSGSGSGGGH